MNDLRRWRRSLSGFAPFVQSHRQEFGDAHADHAFAPTHARSPKTQDIYVRAVANLALYHRQSPDALDAEQIRLYRLHLLQRGLKANSLNPIMGGLRFFYGTTLNNKQLAHEIPYARKEDTLPAVMTRAQVLRLLEAEPDLMMRTIFTAIYAAGLRISEAIRLATHDIQREHMVIHVRQGKGQKDRYVMLSRQLHNVLRKYWQMTRPPGPLLFPGPKPERPITARSVQRAFRQSADRADLAPNVTPHTLRHSFATHLLEQGVDIRVIQDLLGHRHIQSTTRYARVALKTIAEIQSPLELLNLALAGPD